MKTIAALWLVGWFCVLAGAQDAVKPPQQPKTGPGSSEYAHAETNVIERLEGGKHYWLYTPAKPALDKAPVVVFLHGWGAIKPEIYETWIKHICRRGNIVIFPQYQADLRELVNAYAPNAAASIIDALAYLEADQQRVQPLRDKFALVGHSAGGLVAANLASEYEAYKLPKPAACMAVQPGITESVKPLAKRLTPEWLKFGNIPEGCLLLSLYGDSDNIAGWWIARKIFCDAGNVKAADKNLVELTSDVSTDTKLVAEHFAPACSGEGTVNSLDWYGLWKLFDGLCDAAFHDKNRDYALGDTDRQKDMGRFSDGREVAKLKVWKGDAKVDPDEEYEPKYNRDGSEWSKEKPRPRRRER